MIALPAIASAADGDAGTPSIDQRWIPSFSLYSMGNAERRSARMAADYKIVANEPPLSKSDHSVGKPWAFGGTLDLASPVVFDVPGKPRAYVHADVGYTLDLSDAVVTRGDPGRPPSAQGSPTIALQIEHTGGTVRVEAKPVVFSAGIGTVFSFEAFDRGFRFRPTLEWTYRRDTIRSIAGGAEPIVPNAAGNCPCQTVFIRSTQEKGFHSVGPGVELEADVGRMGDFMIGWYGSFRAYYLSGDRKANIKSRGTWTRFDNGQPSGRTDTIFATRYEREPWHYRFGMGIRVSWLPED